jgi:hypothetical protein
MMLKVLFCPAVSSRRVLSDNVNVTALSGLISPKLHQCFMKTIVSDSMGSDLDIYCIISN